jgi:hypothetical protein
VRAQYQQAYGSPRITEESKSGGIPVSRDRVRRLMKANGICAKHKQRYNATTGSKFETLWRFTLPSKWHHEIFSNAVRVKA